MNWQNELVKGYQELTIVHKDLNGANREMQKNIKGLDGWADRVMKKFNIDQYSDYPKRPKIGSF